MKQFNRERRQFRIRKRVTGTSNKPRLVVFRSSQHIYAQIIDDSKGVTVVSESDMKVAKGLKKDRAYEIGKKLAEKALKNKIAEVVFDRAGFLYHGRVAEVARGAREGGLKF